MECKFTIGQKVLCVDRNPVVDPELELGRVYTIEELYPYAYGNADKNIVIEGVHVTLVELQPTIACYPYQNFRPLDDASLEWARELCRKVPAHLVTVSDAILYIHGNQPPQIIRWPNRDDLEDWRLR